MLKKILLAMIASAILLIANTQNTKSINCDEQYESCLLKCDNSNSEDCSEKCDIQMDQCIEKESNNEIDVEKDIKKENY